MLFSPEAIRKLTRSMSTIYVSSWYEIRYIIRNLYDVGRQSIVYSGSGDRPEVTMPEKLTRDTFAQHLNSQFRVQDGAANSISVELVEAVETGTSGPYESFSI